MKRIIALLLVPILSMYFVTVDKYEQDINDLERRISILEGNEVDTNVYTMEFTATAEDGQEFKAVVAYTKIYEYGVYTGENYIEWIQWCAEVCETDYPDGQSDRVSIEEIETTMNEFMITWVSIYENFR